MFSIEKEGQQRLILSPRKDFLGEVGRYQTGAVISI